MAACTGLVWHQINLDRMLCGQGQARVRKQLSNLCEFVLLCEHNPTGGMRLLPCSLVFFLQQKKEKQLGLRLCCVVRFLNSLQDTN